MNKVRPERRSLLALYEELEADVYYLERKGETEAALRRIESFATVVDGDDRMRADLLRAQVLHTMGRLAEAGGLYRRVIEGLPGDARAQAICCIELLAMANQVGDFAIGESAAQQALALIRRRPEAVVALDRIYVGYAQLHQLQGDHAAAVEWYKRALRRLEEPSDSTVTERDRNCGMALSWFGLAKSYVAMGDLVKARFAIDGIRCDPRDRSIQTMAALAEFRFHFRLRSLDRAQQWLATAAESAGEPCWLQEVMLARAHLASAHGDAEAVRSLVEALEQFSPPIPWEIRLGIRQLSRQEGVI